jgi:exodeoxyribonuclease V beta subunit
VARASAEELAERVRLLYVAVTRAEHRCYLAAGRVGDGGTSSLAWLLHARGGAITAQEIDARYKAGPAAALRADVERFAAAAGTTVRLEALPQHDWPRPTPSRPDQAVHLVARRVVRTPGEGWSIGSFTSLVEAGGDAERPDYDQWDRAPGGAGARDRFGFPHGAAAGRCLHDLLEALDFVAPDTRIIPGLLRAHGIETDWAPIVETWIGEVLATPLDDTGRLCLGRIARRARHDELEFHYPARRVDVTHLVRRLRDAGFAGGGFGPATARPAARLDGFVKGYVDAVIEHEGRYFVIDYKSNRLGDGFDAHAGPALVTAMGRGTYWLQYLVYTLAVHRLLARRVAGYEYDRHFGGVYYLFLRGMTPARGHASGVYYDRPSHAVVTVLDEVMRGAGK